jgi:hypothetical protein
MLNEDAATSIKSQAQKPFVGGDPKKQAARNKIEQMSTRIAQMNVQLAKQKAQADFPYESTNLTKDLVAAYASIYEAKKKVDQDQDGDNDFADVQIARMIASGVPKEVAISKTKNKAYNKEEKEMDLYDIVLSYLLENNLAESEKDADAIIENMSDTWIYQIIEERAPGVKPYRASSTQAEVRADAAKAAKKKAEAGKDKPGYGPEDKFKSDWKLRATPSSVSKRKTGETETVSQRMDREKPYAKRMTGQMAREYGSRHAAEVTRVVKGAGEPQAVTYPREKSKPSKDIVRKSKSDD